MTITRWVPRNGAGVILVLAACFGFACDSPASDNGAATSSASAAVAVTASASASAATAPLDFAALQRRARKCKLGPNGVDSDCAGLWRGNDLFTDGQHDAALVALLSDPAPAMRWLAAKGLQDVVFGGAEAKASRPYATEKKLAEQIIASAAKERDSVVAGAVGNTVALIDLAETGTEASVSQLLTTHPVARFRAAAAKALLHYNFQMYERVLRIAKTDAHEGVRISAVLGMASGDFGKRAEATCKDWNALLNSPMSGVVGTAGWKLTYKSDGVRCSTHWQRVCSRIETVARAGQFDDKDDLGAGFWPKRPTAALGALMQQPSVTDAHRNAVVRAARALASQPKNGKSMRSWARDLIKDHDPQGAEFLKKLAP